MSIEAALARRYPTPAWATFFEVQNDAGFRSHRRADAVAMSIWPSRGLVVHGIEVKRDRRDWLKELKDPEKSAPIQRFCDFWWIATDEPKIIREGELPSTWGLLVLEGKVLKSVVEAPRLKADPLDRGFVAMLLRRGMDGMVPKAEIETMVQDRIKQIEARDEHHKSVEERTIETVAGAYRDLQERVRAFKEASGIDITERWANGPLNDPKRLGEAVRAFMSGPQHGLTAVMDRAVHDAEEALTRLKSVADAVRAVTPGQEG